MWPLSPSDARIVPALPLETRLCSLSRSESATIFLQTQSAYMLSIADDLPFMVDGFWYESPLYIARLFVLCLLGIGWVTTPSFFSKSWFYLYVLWTQLCRAHSSSASSFYGSFRSKLYWLSLTWNYGVGIHANYHEAPRFIFDLSVNKFPSLRLPLL